MTKELISDAELFAAVDAEVDELIKSLESRVRVTPEILASAFSDALVGKPITHLWDTRKLRKQETIVAVFNAPVSSGREVLVFQTEDGLLWELCDEGLGWNSYDAPDPTWPKSEQFASLLPATINPRPPTRGPWQFDLEFGHAATLTVSPGRRNSQIRYKLLKRK